MSINKSNTFITNRMPYKKILYVVIGFVFFCFIFVGISITSIDYFYIKPYYDATIDQCCKYKVIKDFSDCIFYHTDIPLESNDDIISDCVKDFRKYNYSKSSLIFFILSITSFFILLVGVIMERKKFLISNFMITN